ncbi:MAG: phage minor head protein [Campylobacterales bacterium]|nr:phage minor head protein [Campylobacterales bacterium]
MVKFDFNLSPDEAIAYLKNKGFKLSFNYDELKNEAHHKAFTVAKVTRLDLLNDIHEAITKSLKDGTSFAEFQKNLQPTLEKKGWWGTQDIVNPKTGEVKTINIGANRLRTIYETNTRMAYNVAREEQMDALPLSVYRRYVSVLLATTRDNHAARHGTIKHKDDPWWKINSPLNGWNCKCKKTAYSKREIERKGWTINEDTLPDIADKDFAYDTRAGSNMAKLSRVDLDTSLSDLPKPQKNQLYENMSEAELLNSFYEKLGVKEGETFIDKINDPMIIDSSLFLDKKTKQLKINKEDRHLLLDELVNVIKEPDEIYLEWDESGMKKNMFRYINIDGKKEAVMAVFRYLKDKTQGATLFHVTRGLEDRRKMKLVYARETDANKQ